MNIKKIKVRVKTLEEIKKGTTPDCVGCYVHNSGYRFDVCMKKYCGKVIELEDWDGNRGGYDGWFWALEVLSEIDVKEHNRNGANS